MAVEFSELQSERLSLLQIAFGKLHQIIQSRALVVAAYRASCKDHHTSSTGLLSGDHEGKGCRWTRPPDSSTYLWTRLLRWLESLSTARCNCLWQR